MERLHTSGYWFSTDQMFLRNKKIQLPACMFRRNNLWLANIGLLFSTDQMFQRNKKIQLAACLFRRNNSWVEKKKLPRRKTFLRNVWWYSGCLPIRELHWFTTEFIWLFRAKLVIPLCIIIQTDSHLLLPIVGKKFWLPTFELIIGHNSLKVMWQWF